MSPSEAELLFGATFLLATLLVYLVFTCDLTLLVKEPQVKLKLTPVYPREAKDAFDEIVYQVQINDRIGDAMQEEIKFKGWVYNMKMRLHSRWIENTVNVKNSRIYMLDVHSKTKQNLASMQDWEDAKKMYVYFNQEAKDIIVWDEKLKPGCTPADFNESTEQANVVLNEIQKKNRDKFQLWERYLTKYLGFLDSRLTEY